VSATAVAGSLVTTSLKVYGMRDAAAAQLAYDTLRQIDGVQQIALNVPLRRINVTHAPRRGITQELVAALRSLGFHAQEKG